VRALILILALTAALALPSPARADVAVEGGGIFSHGTAAGAGALSLGVINVPLSPLTVELTAAVAGNGGYSGSLDARLTLAGTALGAGAGFGTLGDTSHTGAIYNAFLGHTIAPHTAIEARLYFGNARPSSLFAGLRFSF
jgi:hypothetical protein